MKYKLILSYDGTNYSGWQVQKNAPSVQQTFQNAVEEVLGKRYDVTGCSRTDKGVHARCFCCSVSLENDPPCIPAEKLPQALNSRLPDDISVLSAEIVQDSFHPRYDVKYKEYEYLIWNGPYRDPFLRNRAFYYPKKLDEKLIGETAEYFTGKHDFSAFAASGGDVEDTIRNVFYLSVVREGHFLKFNIAADGFLYKMVRNIVGTLIEVSEGKIAPDEIPSIIKCGKRQNAGFTAQPQGLYLNKVVY